MKKFLWSLFGVGALLVSAQVAYTATDSQQFTVSVPKRVTITAPSPSVTINLTAADLTAAELTTTDDVAFANQTWAVKGNVKNGVKVDFDTNPFTNTTHPLDSIYQNARLQVTQGTTTGPATWSLSTASNAATTDYTSVTPGVRISYTSDRVGSSDFVVAMTFVAADLNAVTEGSYQTTVVGTVTEN
jgi:hypothetical protein